MWLDFVRMVRQVMCRELGYRCELDGYVLRLIRPDGTTAIKATAKDDQQRRELQEMVRADGLARRWKRGSGPRSRSACALGQAPGGSAARRATSSRAASASRRRRRATT